MNEQQREANERDIRQAYIAALEMASWDITHPESKAVLRRHIERAQMMHKPLPKPKWWQRILREAI